MGNDPGTTFTVLVVALVIVIGAIVYTLKRDRRPGAQLRSRASSDAAGRSVPASAVEPRSDAESTGRRARAIDPDRIHDLRHLESLRLRIRGSFANVTDAERRKYGGREYLLVREPQNPHDGNAVAVYSGDRRVGYVTAARASSLAPLLDRLEADAFRVSGEGVNSSSIRLWVDVPRTPPLRDYVKRATG